MVYDNAKPRLHGMGDRSSTRTSETLGRQRWSPGCSGWHSQTRQQALDVAGRAGMEGQARVQKGALTVGPPR